jgi:hypothetical protein
MIFDCIYFSKSIKELEVAENDLVYIAFEPQINTFRGQSTVQLNIIDIVPSGNVKSTLHNEHSTNSEHSLNVRE